MSADEFIQARNRAFEIDDISWAAKILPEASSPEVVEAAFHKARLECLHASASKRQASLAWLAQRNMTRLIGGDPVKASDPLPV